MKVHPVPRKRNITLQYDFTTALSEAGAAACRQKKLRRLPHIFAKVLELPFSSDAEVLVEETSDFLKFIVSTDELGREVSAHTVEIHPGVSKIVVRGNGAVDGPFLGELDLDTWRFRLPASTRPDLATASYADGELVVLVPKGSGGEVDEEEGKDGISGGRTGRLVFVP